MHILTGTKNTLVAVAAFALLSDLLAGRVQAQTQNDVSFSVDWHGVLQGTSATGGPPITAGDVLGPAGGAPALGNPLLPPPAIRFTGGLLGLANYNNCVGAGPGDPCGVELDALSYGRDYPAPSDPAKPYQILFSVDEYVTGNGNPGLQGASVSTEGGAVGDACADAFTSVGLIPGPIGPQAGVNLGVIDGDGRLSATGARYPGLGVSEPNRPGQGLPLFPNDEGDNIDALDVGPVADPSSEPIFYSLDGAFFDNQAGVFNSGTSQFQNVQPGDVLVRVPAGAVTLYAPAQVLGLDRNGGPGSDDLDVLILAENGAAGFQPSQNLFDWEGTPAPGAPTDMLLFSVRRGSAVIGKLDSLMGLPIEEGDLLLPPIAGGNGNPAIFIAAEALGLSTGRSGGNSDDMNAGDSFGPEPYRDCNNNNVEDAVDIATNTSPDANMNGIPDECEKPGLLSCDCAAGAPCGNNAAGSGCNNSTGVGGSLLGSGSSSVGVDDLVLTSSGMPVNQFGLTFMGPGFGGPFVMGAGLRCVGGGLNRFAPKPTGAGGSFTLGPGIVAAACNKFGPAGCIESGSTWHFQTWYRDPGGPCGATYNVSNAWTVLFTP